MMGFTNAGGSGAIDVSWSGSNVASVNSGSTAVSTLNLNSNGSISFSVVASDNLSTLSPTATWFAPTSTGIGSSYWVRCTASGLGVTSGTTGTWLALTSGQTWTRNATAGNTRTTTLTLEFSSSGTGTPLIASGTITLDADGT